MMYSGCGSHTLTTFLDIWEAIPALSPKPNRTLPPGTAAMDYYYFFGGGSSLTNQKADLLLTFL
jgi:hypothetical protein